MPWVASSAARCWPTATSRLSTGPPAMATPATPPICSPARPPGIRPDSRRRRHRVSPGQTRARHAVEIMTGAPVPAGADHVVMFEHVDFDADVGDHPSLRETCRETSSAARRKHRSRRRRGAQRRYRTVRRHPAGSRPHCRCGRLRGRNGACLRAAARLHPGLRRRTRRSRNRAATPPDSQFQQLFAGRPGKRRRWTAHSPPARPR